MSAAFGVVFGVFVVAIVALGVTSIRWALRRDRAACAGQAERGQGADPDTPTPVSRGPDAEKGAP